MPCRTYGRPQEICNALLFSGAERRPELRRFHNGRLLAKTGRSHTPGRVANEALHPHINGMQDTERFSETVSERKQRVEAAISEALQREATRHEAALKNMHRLRALRLERASQT